MLSMLAENTAAQPANIERSSPDQAPQGWRPTGTGSYTCLPLLLESAAADVPLDCKHLIENSPPCYDLSSDSDSEVEVLREASKQAAINKHRIYIVNQKWGSSCMHIVNHKNKQYLLLEEVAKLLKCSSGLALMLSRTSGRINLKCETVHQNDLSNFFKELYNLHLDHYVRDHQVQLLPIASLLSILSLFPEFEASVAPHVRESIKTFNPEASCWSF
ncbi:hypothetical protein B566_EDAN010019 [Ephemera danica]|nr:hypothetical protein B566_EDAN010019 [Ephemera danica]